jgi:hypothetical protein
LALTLIGTWIGVVIVTGMRMPVAPVTFLMRRQSLAADDLFNLGETLTRVRPNGVAHQLILLERSEHGTVVAVLQVALSSSA